MRIPLFQKLQTLIFYNHSYYLHGGTQKSAKWPFAVSAWLLAVFRTFYVSHHERLKRILLDMVYVEAPSNLYRRFQFNMFLTNVVSIFLYFFPFSFPSPF